MRLHFLETNLAPKIPQRDGEVESLVNRTVRIRFSNKRTFTPNARDVDEENGVFQMHSASHLRERELPDATRKARLL